jgi:hypothetical protein
MGLIGPSRSNDIVAVGNGFSVVGAAVRVACKRVEKPQGEDAQESTTEEGFDLRLSPMPVQ